MAQHTPGPWVAVERPTGGGIWGVETEKERHDLGLPHREGICGNLSSPFLTEANALLIAAAPDLLSAAQDAFATIKSMSGIIGEVEERSNPWNETLRSLRAAIARATGAA